jgi:Ni,Fe-hydrogenase maturation factor
MLSTLDNASSSAAGPPHTQPDPGAATGVGTDAQGGATPAPATPAPALVVGMGAIDRGDDAVGPHVAALVLEEIRGRGLDHVRVLVRSDPARLLDLLCGGQEWAVVVVLDAAIPTRAAAAAAGSGRTTPSAAQYQGSAPPSRAAAPPPGAATPPSRAAAAPRGAAPVLPAAATAPRGATRAPRAATPALGTEPPKPGGPGTVVVLETGAGLPPLPLAADHRAAGTHGIGLGTSLELARALGHLPARVVVVAVTAEAFGHGRLLTEPVRAALPRAVDEVLAVLSCNRMRGPAPPEAPDHAKHPVGTTTRTPEPKTARAILGSPRPQHGGRRQIGAG